MTDERICERGELMYNQGWLHSDSGCIGEMRASHKLVGYLFGGTLVRFKEFILFLQVSKSLLMNGKESTVWEHEEILLMHSLKLEGEI